MLSFREYMTEAFTTPLPWHLTKDDGYASIYKFNVGDKQGCVEIWSEATRNTSAAGRRGLFLPRTDKDHEVLVIFHIDGMVTITGKGQGVKFSIFATVMDCIKHYTNKYQPAFIYFSADKFSGDKKYADPQDEDMNMSRADLYNAMIRKFAGSIGYRLKDAHSAILEVNFTLERIKK